VAKIFSALLLGAVTFAGGQGLAQGNASGSAPELAKIFDTARYVYVEPASGQSGAITPGDRQAMDNLQKLLRDWNRYTLTMSRQNADLILVVHKGSGSIGNTPVVIGGAPRQPGRNPFPRDPSDSGNSGPGNSGQDDGPGLTAETGSPDDELAVYTLSGSNSLMGPLWHESSRNGLARPKLTLFQHLKEDVEEAYPH
jgi:hypothetical protein